MACATRYVPLNCSPTPLILTLAPALIFGLPDVDASIAT